MSTTNGFPADWTEWQARWTEWRAEHRSVLRPTPFRFPPKNILADEVLGIWRIGDRDVELSAVTFPDFTRPPSSDWKRYVGITYGTGAGPDTALASSFEELEDALGIR